MLAYHYTCSCFISDCSYLVMANAINVCLCVAVLLGLAASYESRESRAPVAAQGLNRHFAPSTAAKYWNNAHHVTAEEKLTARKKRQSTCSLSSEGEPTLEQRLAEVQCDPDYLSALQNLQGVECSFILPLRLANERVFVLERSYPDCGTNGSGVFCGVHDALNVNSPRDVARDIVNDCFDKEVACSVECRSLLESFASRFGCCVHSVLIIQSSDLIRALTPQLWEDCGVALPAPCDDAPPELAPLQLNASCSHECTVNQAQALFCKYQALELIEAYSECGEEEDALRIAQSCGFNHRGDFCFTAVTTGVFFNLLALFAGVANVLDDAYFIDVYSKCVSVVADRNCPTECRDALVQAKETYGCCFNNANLTALGFSFSPREESLRDFVTSYDLWSACVVEPPGFCEFPGDNLGVYDELTHCSVEMCEIEPTNTTTSNSGSSPFPVGVVGAVALPVILLMVAVPAMIYCCRLKRTEQSKKMAKSAQDKRQPVESPASPPPPQNDTSSTTDTTDRAATIHYYDYITPLKPNSNYQSPQSSLTVDNMTNNASYNKVLHDNNIPNPTSSLHRPPLPPPNDPTDGAVREPRPSTDDEEYISMNLNPAHDAAAQDYI